MKVTTCAICFTAIFLHACAWVEPTAESEKVTLVREFNVKACKKITTTTATVASKVGIIERNVDTITEELVTLAKNRAAELGGDSIVSQGPEVDGTMKFDVYKCAE